MRLLINNLYMYIFEIKILVRYFSCYSLFTWVFSIFINKIILTTDKKNIWKKKLSVHKGCILWSMLILTGTMSGMINEMDDKFFIPK